MWTKFCLLIVMLPLLGLTDVLLLRSSRGPLVWIRACGFEVCTAFGAATVVRVLLDLGRAGMGPGCQLSSTSSAWPRRPKKTVAADQVEGSTSGKLNWKLRAIARR
jgi:hypothetical protein